MFMFQINKSKANNYPIEDVVIDLSSISNIPHKEGRLFYDNVEKCIAYYNDIPEVTMQVGRELWLRCNNNTASLIPNCSIVCIGGAANKQANITLADADDFTKNRVLGVTTMDISAGGYGEVTVFGYIHGIDLSSFANGDIIYLSNTPGQITNIRPVFPSTPIIVGQVMDNAIDGQLFVNIMPDTYDYSFDGAAIIPQSLTISQSGNNVYAEVEKLGGGDLAIQIQGNVYQLNCTVPSKAKILLTNGSSTTPYFNFVWVELVNNIPALATGPSFPMHPFVSLGHIALLDPAFTTLNGPLVCVPTISSVVNNNQGRMSLVLERLAQEGALYSSGLTCNVSINTAATPDTVNLTISSGTALITERISLAAKQVLTDGVYVANASGLGTLTKYQKIYDIGLIKEDASGASLSGRSYNLVFFMSTNGKIFVNLPTGSYNSEVDAYNDTNHTAVVSVPTELKLNSLLLLKLPLRHKTQNGGEFSFINTAVSAQSPQFIDLRGMSIGLIASTAYGMNPIFVDTSFRISSSLDSSAQISFNAANITSAQTRSIIMPDANVDLGNLTVSNIATASKTGTHSSLVTGTKGTTDYMAKWDASGDIVDSIAEANVFNKASNTTDNITEGSTKLFFTDARAVSAVEAKLTDTNSIDFTTGTTITADVKVASTMEVTASGINVKDDSLTVDKIAHTALQTGATGDNTKLTTKGYVDKVIADSTASLMKLQGDWDASTNTPDISGTTITGYTWRVSVDGSTNIGGITHWHVGDLVTKTDTGWIKVDNSDVNDVWGNIGGDIINQTDLYAALQARVVTAELYSYFVDSATITFSHINSPVSVSATIANNSLTTTYIATNSKTGQHTKLVTGTAGTVNNLMMWNTNGDAVDSNISVSNIFNKATNTADNITEGVTNKFYSDAKALTAVTNQLADTNTIDFTYNTTITADVKKDNTTITSDANGLKVGTISTSNIATNAKTGVYSKVVTGGNGTSGQLTQWDNNGDLINSGTLAANVFDKSVNTTDNITEGTTHLYYTDARAISAVEAKMTDTNSINLTTGAAITADVKVASTMEITASGINVKDGAITYAKVAAANIQTGASGDNTKFTTKGYVDNLTIYAPAVHVHAVTDITNFSSEVVKSYGSATKDPTGFVTAQQSNITLSFNDSTRALSINAIAGNYSFYVQGTLFSRASDSIVIADSYSQQFVYYNASGVLTSTTTFTDSLITDFALVAILNYDSGLKELPLLAFEAHGIMGGLTHLLWHKALGGSYISGMKLAGFSIDGTGNVNANSQFNITSGQFMDEDITFNLSAQPTVARMPVFYKQGAAGYWRWNWTNKVWQANTVYLVGQRCYVGDNIFEVTVGGISGGTIPTFTSTNFGNTTTDNTVTWRYMSNKNYAVIGGLGANNRLMYNQWTGTVWQLTEVSINNGFVLIHVFSTNNYRNASQDFDYIAVLGQAEYATAAAARTGASTEISSIVLGTGYPSNEIIPVATIIAKTSSTYTSVSRSLFTSISAGVNYMDWTVNKLSAGNSPTAHANLTGLGNDDHTQYALLLGRSGGQTLYGGTLTGNDLTLYNNSVDNVFVNVTSLYNHLNNTNVHVNHGTVSITGTNSVTGGGDISASRTLSLVNDSASPGDNKVYGTSSSGVRGFFDARRDQLYFSLPEQVDNTSVYFYSFGKQFEGTGTKIPSGNSNGISYANACNPIIAPYSGTITRAILVLKGAGVSNGTVTYPVTYQSNLYNVGYSTEGTLMGSVNFSITNANTVGTYSVAATNATIENTGLSIAVTKGDKLALKYVNGTGASLVGQMLNAFVMLEIVPTV